MICVLVAYFSTRLAVNIDEHHKPRNVEFGPWFMDFFFYGLILVINHEALDLNLTKSTFSQINFESEQTANR